MTSPIRVLRQIVAPNGKHRDRLRRPLLLPDEPFPAPAEPVRYSLLDEDELEQQLEAGDVVANEFADCPACERNTFHAMHRDGSRRCWTCSTTTIPGDS